MKRKSFIVFAALLIAVLCMTLAACGGGEGDCKHEWGDWTVKDKPTCLAVGTESRVCALDASHTETRSVEKLAHTGEFTCSVCGNPIAGDDYFVNALSSLLHQDFAICLNNVYVSGEYMDDMVYTVEFAELSVGVDESGDIYGYGSGKINIDGIGLIPATMDVTALIKDEKIYVKTIGNGFVNGGHGGAPTTSDETISTYIVLPFDGISEMNYSDAQILSYIPEFYTWCKSTIVPIIDNIITLSKLDITDFMKGAAEEFFKVAQTENGFVLTLDAERIVALNESLYKNSLAHNIDDLCGEGTFDGLKADVLKLAGTTVQEVLDKLAEKGVDAAEILDALDNLAVQVTSGESKSFSELLSVLLDSEMPDFGAILKDKEFLGSTILELINSGSGSNAENGQGGGAHSEITPATLEAQLNKHGESTFYALISKGDESVASEMKAISDEIVGMIAECVELSVNTATTGEINSVLVKLDGELMFGGEISIKSNYESQIDYTALAGEIETLIGKLDVNEMVEKLLSQGGIIDGVSDPVIEYCENGKIKTISGTSIEESIEEEVEGNGVIYRYIQRTEKITTVYVPQNPALFILPDCGDWINVMVDNSRTKEVITYSYIKQHIDENGNVVQEELLNEEKNNHDWRGSIDGLWNSKTGEIVKSLESKHNFVEDTAKHEPAEGCTKLGKRYFSCTHCDMSYIEYYINGHTEGESTVEFDTDERNCEGGVTITKYCAECGETIYNEHSTYHERNVIEKEFDLSGMNTCGNHRVYIEKCACGRDCERLVETIHESGGKSYTTVMPWNEYSCADCELVVSAEDLQREENGCEVTETGTCIVKAGDRVVEKYKYTQVYDDHSCDEFVSLKEGAKSCRDGCIVRRVCRNCDYTSQKEVVNEGCQWGIVEVVNFTEYGVEGGGMHRYGCACGRQESEWRMFGDYYRYADNGSEYYVFDGGFVVKSMRYEGQSGSEIGTFRKYLIGYDEESDTAQDEIVIFLG